MPVVVSADGNGTDVAVVRARRAAALGAAALMVLPPMFIKPDGENLYRYYQRIARAVEVEIMVQDAPQLTGVALPAPLLVRLNRDCPNITAVKIEGTPAGPKTSEVLALSDNRMDVFAGWGGLSFWEGLQRGAKGCMPAANFGPALARVYELYRAGDYPAGAQPVRASRAVYQLVDAVGGPVCLVRQGKPAAPRHPGHQRPARACQPARRGHAPRV